MNTKILIVEDDASFGLMIKTWLNKNGYEAVLSTHYEQAKTELADAKKTYGDRIMTKAGDIYELPFEDESFDGLMMVRFFRHSVMDEEALNYYLNFDYIVGFKDPLNGKTEYSKNSAKKH